MMEEQVQLTVCRPAECPVAQAHFDQPLNLALQPAKPTAGHPEVGHRMLPIRSESWNKHSLRTDILTMIS